MFKCEHNLVSVAFNGCLENVVKEMLSCADCCETKHYRTKKKNNNIYTKNSKIDSLLLVFFSLPLLFYL